MAKSLVFNIEGNNKAEAVLSKFRADLKKVTESGEPLKKKLRDIQRGMADLNMMELSNTDVFREMAEQAGQYADAMADARQAVQAFANDNMNIQAVAQAFQLVGGGISMATGAMSLLGVESDKVQNAMLKVQSAIALANGAQQIANLLNKDSVLMLRIRQIRMNVLTAATTANTAAQGVNTAATGASTIAKKAWNVVTAISKALLGDYTGLILVGAAALATYAICTQDSAKETKRKNEEESKARKIIEDKRKKEEEYYKSIGNETGKLIGKYRNLQNQYNRLKSDSERTQWIKDNETGFKNLGLSVKNLTDAEKVFVSQSGKVIKAFELRAQAAAAENLMVKAYTEYYEKMAESQNKIGEGKYYKAEAGKKIDDKGRAEIREAMIKRGEMDRYGKVTSKGVGTRKYYDKDNILTEEGARLLNKHRNDTALSAGKKVREELKKELEGTTKVAMTELERSEAELKKMYANMPQLRAEDDRKSSGKQNRQEVKVDEQSLKYAEDQLKKFQENRKLIVSTDVRGLEENRRKIDYWTAEVAKRKALIQIDTDDGSLEFAQKRIADLSRMKADITVSANIDRVRKAEDEVNGLFRMIEEAGVEADVRITGDDLDSLKEKAAGLQDAFKPVNTEVNTEVRITGDDLDAIREKAEALQETFNSLAAEIDIEGTGIDDIRNELSSLFSFISDNSDRKISFTTENTELVKERVMRIFRGFDRLAINAQVKVNAKELDTVKNALALWQQEAERRTVKVPLQIKQEELKKVEENITALAKYKITIPIDETEELEKVEESLKYWLHKKKGLALEIDAIADKESLKYLEDEYDRLKKKEVELRETLIDIADKKITVPVEIFERYDTDWFETQKEMARIQKKINDMKLTLNIPIEGSVLEAETKINEIKKQLNNMPFASGTNSSDLQSGLEMWEKELKTRKKHFLNEFESSVPTVEPYEESKRFPRGSVIDKKKSLENAKGWAEEVEQAVRMKLIPPEDAEKVMAIVNEELQSIGLEPITIEIKGDTSKLFRQVQETAGYIQEAFGAVSAIDGMVSSVTSLVKAFEEGSTVWEKCVGVVNVLTAALSAMQTVMAIVEMFQKAHTVATIGTTAATQAVTAAETEKVISDGAVTASAGAVTAANKIAEASYLDLAAASIFAAHAEIPFAGVPTAAGYVATMMSAMAAQHAAAASLAAFAEGGIVSGSQRYGDRQIIRANAGEMVLNSRQQQKLFNLLNSNTSGDSGRGGGTVRFEISGSTLKGVLNNYDRKSSRWK